MKLPITAILPIYNGRERLQRHLTSVIQGAGQVQEIVVVDSGSSDGTLELARKILDPHGAEFLNHPPGLYASWNAGIAAAGATWCYISTVEDPISTGGFEHLLEVGEKHQADLVVSPPEMRNEDGTRPVADRMPSHHLAEAITGAGLLDKLLSKTEAIALLCGLMPHGLLGSSAGNLYRTAFLQSRPFPSHVGHCGDTAWGAMAAPWANVAFTPRVCSQFYCQTRHGEMPREAQLAQYQTLSNLALDSLKNASSSSPELAIAYGWLISHLRQTESLWHMLAAHEAYERHLAAKYEGGILQYLRRAIRDEWMKFTAPMIHFFTRIP